MDILFIITQYIMKNLPHLNIINEMLDHPTLEVIRKTKVRLDGILLQRGNKLAVKIHCMILDV